jgi:hypothetical protein
LNRSLKKYLDSWIEPDTSAEKPKHGARVPEPRPLENRLSAQELVELIARYQGGATPRELADDLGVGKTAIVRLLRDHRVRIRPRGAGQN